MIPVKIESYDLNKNIYVYCKCPLPGNYAIVIQREKGKLKYPFCCDICKTSGIIHVNDDSIVRVEEEAQ